MKSKWTAAFLVQVRRCLNKGERSGRFSACCFDSMWSSPNLHSRLVPAPVNNWHRKGRVVIVHSGLKFQKIRTFNSMNDWIIILPLYTCLWRTSKQNNQTICMRLVFTGYVNRQDRPLHNNKTHHVVLTTSRKTVRFYSIFCLCCSHYKCRNVQRETECLTLLSSHQVVKLADDVLSINDYCSQ